MSLSILQPTTGRHPEHRLQDVDLAELSDMPTHFPDHGERLAKIEARVEYLSKQIDGDKRLDKLTETDKTVARIEERLTNYSRIGIGVATVLFTLLGVGVWKLFDIAREQRSIASASLSRDLTLAAYASSFEEIPKILEQAKNKDIQIENAALVESGKRIASSAPSPQAWSALNELVSYRTTLTKQPENELRPTTGVAQFRVPGVPGKSKVLVQYMGWSDANEQSPILEYIGENLNKGRERLPQSLVVSNGGVKLDNVHARGIVFVNCDIAYDGGPVKLEGVRFVNCRFQIDSSPAGTALAQTILQPSDTANIRLPMA